MSCSKTLRLRAKIVAFCAKTLRRYNNHHARLALSQAEGIWLDCGNHHDSGQVVCGNSSDREEVLRSIERMDERQGVTFHLPNAALLFPELLEPEEVREPTPDASCAEMVEAGSQHLLVNDAIATAAAGYIYRLLHRMPLVSFMSFVSLDTIRPVPVLYKEILIHLTR